MTPTSWVLLSFAALGGFVQSQKFSDLPLPVVWPNISTSCFNALNSTISNCPSLLAALSFNNLRPTSDQLTSLCTANCKTGLSNIRQTIVNGCQGSNDVIKYWDGNVYPATYFVDRFQYRYGLACRQDSSNGTFCNSIFQSWLGQTNLTAAQNCSDCLLGVQQLQLNSPFGYHAQAAADFQSTTSSCGKTGYPLTSPAKYTISSATTSATSTSRPTTVCGSTYTVQSGDTCNSISLAKKVSTFAVVSASGANPACTNLQAGAVLCLPSPCQLYTVQATDTCASILSAIGNGVTDVQFLSWNPNINSVCSNFAPVRGNQICVSPPGGFLTNVSASTPLAVSTATTPVAKPTNAPAESNSRCARWYTIQDGDYCQSVAQSFNIVLKDFYFLNPEINANCTNLLLGLAYCVQAVGTISTYSGYPTTSQYITLTSTSYSTAASTALVLPGRLTTSTTQYPTASGVVASCSVYQQYTPPQPIVDQANSPSLSSDISSFVNTCQFVAYYNSVPQANLTAWNPSLSGPNGTCLDLQPGYRYCVSMNVTIPDPPTAPCLSVNQTQIPSGTSKDCTCYTLINGYDNSTTLGCASIATNAHIGLSNLTSWNSWVGSNCDTGLYANLASNDTRAVCIRVNGTGYISSPPPSSTTSMGPTQSGIASNCVKYYTVQSGDSCSAIDTTYGITFSQFYGWNPAVGSNCQYLQIGYAYCVAVSGTGSSATTTTTTSSAPAPTRSGTASNCSKYYTVQSGDSCQAIDDKFGITFATLYKWNTNIGSNCESLWVGYSLCVAGGPA